MNENEYISNNKRIAKNTLFLYFRMLLVMVVSLYTVRVVLNTLGKMDYGIYDIVGGIVIMFSFLSNTMSVAAQRFFSFELGRNDFVQLKKTFSMIFAIYFLLAIAIWILAETLGLWFLNTKMNIPTERMNAAHWVYQFAILSFICTMLKSPFDAVLISHENMKIYAYISIVDVVLKLGIVYLLLMFNADKLKLYAILMFAVSLINVLIYSIYCNKKYPESRYSFHWDKSLFKTLTSYSGWNLLGGIAVVLNTQGLNILLNIFFGPVVNTARGIAYQVNAAVNQFSQNFMTTVRPQIIKYYAQDEKKNMHQLIFRSTKYSFYFLLILSLPLLIETHYILTLWIENLPEYTVVFTRLAVILALIDSLSYPLMAGVQATGRIKNYHIILSVVTYLNLPFCYCFLKIGYQPYTIFYITLINSLLCWFVRILVLQKMISLSLQMYIKRVFIPVLLVFILSLVISLLVPFLLQETLIRLLISITVCVIVSVITVYLVGLNISEREYIFQTIKTKFITVN